MNCVADMKASTTPRRDAGCAKSRQATILGSGLDSRAGLLQKLLKIAHTVGHALEELIDFTLRHGEAVGIVMVAAALIRVIDAMPVEQPADLPKYPQSVKAQQV